MNYYINLSTRLLEKANSNEDSSTLRRELFHITIGGLTNKVNSDELRMIFWENVYNAYLLVMLKEKIRSKDILKIKRIKISKYILSLNDIEYGILRRPKFKIGVPIASSFLYPSYIKLMAVDKTDASVDTRLNKHILNQIAES